MMALVLGRHVVFPATSDSTDRIRDADSVLFTLLARSAFYARRDDMPNSVTHDTQSHALLLLQTDNDE